MFLPTRAASSFPVRFGERNWRFPGGSGSQSDGHSCQRDVCFTDLDRNGHMNNTRYMDWIDDLLPSDFHREHPVKEFAVRYHSEAREGQRLDLHWDFVEDNCLRVDARRRNETRDELVFSCQSSVRLNPPDTVLCKLEISPQFYAKLWRYFDTAPFSPLFFNHFPGQSCGETCGECG